MIECYFDGACDNNPGGYIGFGAVIVENGVEIMGYSGFANEAPGNTNNVAEYCAFDVIIDTLIEGDKTDEEITVYGDSKLVIEQMFGTWKIKSGAYASYAHTCKKKLGLFTRLKGQGIPREQNTRADYLSNEAMKKHKSGIAQR